MSGADLDGDGPTRSGGTHGPQTPPAIAIVGPTAVGKTAVAVALARQIGAEIVSADSMQVYRYLDIGTAKPTVGERAQAAFHLIDIVDPDQEWTLADYKAAAEPALAEIAGRGRMPLIVGGTGLYVRAVTTRLDIPSVRPNPELRARLQGQAEEHGTPWLHARLASIDPVAAGRIHVNDLGRIVRALEVHETLGVTLSELHARNRRDEERSEGRPVIVGLNYADRRLLYARIDRRVDAMIRMGLEGEVRGLIERGYGTDLRPMQSLGYRHIGQYLAGTLAWDDAVDLMKRDTRHYARRQLIWFRGDPRVQWVEVDQCDTDTVAARVLAILSRDSRLAEDNRR
jgi:tRNA dimethylallyltransferase